MIIPRLDGHGGAEKFFLECAVRWQKKNDVTIYTTSFNKDLIKEYNIETEIKAIRPIIKNPSLNLMTLPLEMRLLSDKIGKHEIYNPHLFPTNLIKNHPSVGVPQEPPRMLYDLKKDIMARNDLNFYKKALFFSFSPLIKYINSNYTELDEIVANSLYSKNYIEKVYKREVNNVVYPGVDWKKFLPSQENKKIILSVNRLFPEKRVDIAIKTMKFLDDYSLWIVGEGNYKSNLEKLVFDLNLENKVKFLGNINEKKLIEVYSKCFCTIFTPLREPFGMVALESMAAGKPVIGCKEGGFTELMENNKHGFLVDPEPEKIAEKIIYLSKNEDVYKKMSENCIKTAKIYSWDKTSKELLTILESFSQSNKSL